MQPVRDRVAADAPLQQLAEGHRDAIWRYLRVLGCDASTADDLTHEAFLVVLRRADFDATDSSAAFAFLRTTARNLLLAHRRTRRAQRDIEEGDRVWDERCGSDHGNRRLDALRACLARLPDKSQRMLNAVYRDGEGRRQVGQRFGLGPQGVKSALRRLRHALERCIGERLEAQDRPR